jgi:hypothetical protein
MTTVGAVQRSPRPPTDQREQVPFQLEPELGLDLDDRHGAETKDRGAHTNSPQDSNSGTRDQLSNRCLYPIERKNRPKRATDPCLSC